MLFGKIFFANAEPNGMPIINGNKASKDTIAISDVNIPKAGNIGICVIPTPMKKKEIEGAKVSRLRLRLLRNVTEMGADNPAAVCIAPLAKPTGIANFCAVVIDNCHFGRAKRKITNSATATATAKVNLLEENRAKMEVPKIAPNAPAPENL